MSYLQITGLLNADREFVPNPFYVTEDGPPVPYQLNSWTSIAWVELVDKSGTLMSRTPIIIEPVCAHPSSLDTVIEPVYVLSGLVDLPQNATMVRINVGEKIVHELKAIDTPPTIDVDWSSLEKINYGQVKVSWPAQYEDPKALAFSIYARSKGDD